MDKAALKSELTGAMNAWVKAAKPYRARGYRRNEALAFAYTDVERRAHFKALADNPNDRQAWLGALDAHLRRQRAHAGLRAVVDPDPKAGRIAPLLAAQSD